MMLVSLPLAGIVIHSIHDTSYQDEETVYVDEVATDGKLPGGDSPTDEKEHIDSKA